MNRCSSPTGPKTHPKRIRRYGLWMDCMIIFGIIRSNKTKHIRNIIVSRYLRLRQGLGPKRPLLSAVVGVGGVVRRKGFPLLGPFGLPSWGGLPFLISPSRCRSNGPRGGQPEAQNLSRHRGRLRPSRPQDEEPPSKKSAARQPTAHSRPSPRDDFKMSRLLTDDFQRSRP